MQRLEIVLYEEILHGILDSLYHLRMGIIQLKVMGNTKDPEEGEPEEASLQSGDSSRRSSYLKAQKDSAETLGSGKERTKTKLHTVHTLIHLNGPTVYFIPSGLLRPVLKLHLTNFLLAGHADLTMPYFQGPCSFLCFFFRTIVYQPSSFNLCLSTRWPTPLLGKE